jgi:hypothetical protein
MRVRRSGVSFGSALVLALLVGVPGPPAAAQSPAAPAASAAPAAPTPPDSGRPHKSVYGTLSSVEPSLNGIVMKTSEGKRLAWRFDRRVVEAAAQFKPGDPMIVIYRQITPSEKRVTAVAFPGSASSPIYVNTTGSRVLVRSTAAVDGACGAEGGPVAESLIPDGGVAEVLEACWCCAVPGESCTPGNKSGQGRALLVNCFK